MTEHDIWSIPNVRELIDEAVQYVIANNPGVKVEDLNIRLGWSDDFDTFPGGVAAQTASYWCTLGVGDNEFVINPITKHYAVIFLGFLLGNVGTDLNHLQVTVGTKKVREYPGVFISSQMNDIFIAPDGIYAEQKKAFRVNVNSAAAYAGDSASCFPLLMVIEVSGA